MPIELRSWINPQPYSNSYSTAPIAREAAYFTPVPEPVTADPDYISAEALRLIKQAVAVRDAAARPAA